uniref:Carbonic anhydrase n=1 Tax=Pyropia yezoensis TaxID=2788 RepID=A0A8E8PFQ6_PYRYE|nr:beta-carbonic anhydrase [Neopyropia yezoensis]
MGCLPTFLRGQGKHTHRERRLDKTMFASSIHQLACGSRFGALGWALGRVSVNATAVVACTDVRLKQYRGFHGSCKRQHKDDADVHAKVAEYLKEDEKDLPKELMGSHPDLEDVLKGNKEWVKKMNDLDPEFFKRLGGKQHPRYLYIGCSDARVDPLQLMGLPQGSLFVHRNVGNVVSNTDLNLLTVVDFAVNFLKVPHIVVCGHYDCGAVRGSIAQPQDGGLGLVENWLTRIRDVARLHRHELMAIEDPEAKHRRLVELNVTEQSLNLYKIGTVQKARLDSYQNKDTQMALPRVHGMVFDASVGILHKLPMDFKKEIEENRAIYDMYKSPK